MYESPIQILQNEFQKQIETQMENGVMKAIAKCGYQVNVNKEELLKALQYDRDQYEKGYVDAIKEFTNPHPYGFEDLKPNMWVWDEKNNECIFITNVDIKDKTICCVFSYDSDIEQFEENRFYPLTKAMQYQEVKDE